KFAFNDFLRKEYRFGLDPSSVICPRFVQGCCTMGNSCRDKHPVSLPRYDLVCRYWLKSLCKMGESCGFLHEYNPLKMPDCDYLTRYGVCYSDPHCDFPHVHPDSRIPLCPLYENGFCHLGPTCSKKHIPKAICKFFLASFCPDGRQVCKEGAHPKWTDPKKLRKSRIKRSRE
ncbi:hypothetical protein BZA77DRAFT_229217, partial [Pyronema omphalodes]